MEKSGEFTVWFPDLYSEGHYSHKGEMEAIGVASTRENDEPKKIS